MNWIKSLTGPSSKIANQVGLAGAQEQRGILVSAQAAKTAKKNQVARKKAEVTRRTNTDRGNQGNRAEELTGSQKDSNPSNIDQANLETVVADLNFRVSKLEQKMDKLDLKKEGGKKKTKSKSKQRRSRRRRTRGLF